MAKMTKRTDGHWGLDITKAGVVNLNTAGKYLNADIDVITKEGQVTINDISQNTGVTATAADGTITLTKKVSLTPNVSENGWIDAGTAREVTVSLTTEMETQADIDHDDVTTVSGSTATRATAHWNTGYIVEGTLNAATFANSGSTGKTYVDISGTTEAPILISDDYLYINSGFVDDLKISLSKLVPDGMVVPADHKLADGILSGYAAYNNDGQLITGNIPTKSAAGITFDGGEVTVASGYYASNTTVDMPKGSATLSGVASGAISSLSPVLGSDGKYGFGDTVTLTGTVSAVVDPGYIDTIANGVVDGTATISAKLDQIKLDGTLTGKTSAVVPVIHTNAIGISGVVDAAAAAATTTAPTSGVYVAIQSDADKGVIKANPSVDTAGYGKVGEFLIADAEEKTVGAEDSAVTYVKIKEAKATVAANKVSFDQPGWYDGTELTVAAGTVKNNARTLEPAATASWSTNETAHAGFLTIVAATAATDGENVTPVVDKSGYITQAEATGATMNVGAASYSYEIQIYDGSWEYHA